MAEKDRIYKHYNGLKADMNSFAKFIFIYETKIKYLQNEKDFLATYQQAYDEYKKQIRSYVRYVKIEILQQYKDLNELQAFFGKRNTLFFTQSKVQVLDFCRHLRNAFGHALLVKEGKIISIKDYKSQKTITAEGNLAYDSVIEFIKRINVAYENQNI